MRISQRTIRGALALTLASLLWAPAALATPVTETLGDGRGTIDWTQGTLIVIGSGAPPDRGSPAQKRLLAKRAAVSDGYRQLAELVNGVRVNSETVVKDFVIESDTIKTQVNALVKGAHAGEPRYLSDGTVEVDVTIALHGPASLFAAVDFDHKIAKPLALTGTDPVAEPPAVPSPRPSAAPAPPSATAPKSPARPGATPTPNPRETAPAELTRAAPKPLPAAPQAVMAAVTAPVRPNAAANPSAGGYSGVIIDCREISIQPAMNPTIMDEGGHELYVGKLPIDPDQVINVGIVGYSANLDEATANTERIGSNPLILKAKRTSGQYKADVILSTADSTALVNANETQGFLAQSHVLFLMRP
ncbi:MAG: hypothetical protein H7338_03715 [Candidatus Sericytochromatia bacterium]|nr:hypothetical protein [Candidatus Sericytochromatia bacterium]